jgi:hypothetical protein
MSETTVRPAQDVVEGALAGSGEADVGLVDAEIFHQVEDLELVLDRRVLDRRVLQAVAQCLVEERVSLGDETALAVHLVPVEDELRRSTGAGRGVMGHEWSIALAWINEETGTRDDLTFRAHCSSASGGPTGLTGEFSPARHGCDAGRGASGGGLLLLR